MRTNVKLLTFFLLSFLFVFLFYDRSYGLNLYIFQLLLIAVPFGFNQFNRHVRNHWMHLCFALVLSTAAFINHSTIGFLMSWFAVFAFGVAVVNERLHSMHFTFASSMLSLAMGPYTAFKSAMQLIPGSVVSKKHLRKASIYALPMVLIGLFAAIYSGANPQFGGYTASFFNALENGLSWIWKSLNGQVLGLFVLGSVVVGSVFYSCAPSSFLKTDLNDRGWLVRLRKGRHHHFNMVGLKNERQAGVFLLSVLNIMLVMLLFTEIQEVWLGFEWEGGFLKGFVHEGIYLLIVSILISMGIVLYFFRGNQNFFRGTPWLKRLTYVWLLLNALLVVSVAYRNLLYVEYFALAYKRIGVFFFLAACWVGIFSVYKKVNQCRNALYLFRFNSIAVYGLLTLMAVVNWDVWIARYNFRHFGTAMVELDYMAVLSNKALPSLNQPLGYIKEQQKQQQMRLDLPAEVFREQYMDGETYAAVIETRQKAFIQQWEGKDWLEWNPAEARAYYRLTKAN